MLPVDGPQQGTFWKIDGADMDLQHHVSLNTCPACHAGETGTHGKHVIPGPDVFGTVSLSDFLTGSAPLNDPRGQMDGTGTKTLQRTYDDLTRRKQILACVAAGLGMPCLCQKTLQQISTPH